MSSLFLFFFNLPPFCNKSLTKKVVSNSSSGQTPWRSTKNWRSSAMSRPVAVPSSRPGRRRRIRRWIRWIRRIRWKVLSAVETKVPGYYEKMKDEVNWLFFLQGFFKDEVEKYTS